MDPADDYAFRYTPDEPPPTPDAPHDPSPAPPSPTPSDTAVVLATAVLRGMIAAENVGDWTLSLFQQQLIVDSLTTNKGGVYYVGGVAAKPRGFWWFTLYGRDDSPLPLSIARQSDGSLAVVLASEPNTDIPGLPPLPGK